MEWGGGGTRLSQSPLVHGVREEAVAAYGCHGSRGPRGRASAGTLSQLQKELGSAPGCGGREGAWWGPGRLKRGSAGWTGSVCAAEPIPGRARSGLLWP